MSLDSNNEREAARRQLMFVPGEDFYFLAYTTFILLAEFKCNGPEKLFVDTRKIAYVADMLGSDSDLRTATSAARLSSAGRSRLAVLYDRAAARHAPLERIMTALARRGIITSRRTHGEPDQISLREDTAVEALIGMDAFDAERHRLRVLRRSVPLLRTMSLYTLKERLYRAHGVFTWGD